MPFSPNKCALAVALALLAATSSSGQDPQRQHPGPINLVPDQDRYMLQTGHSVGCLRPGVESGCRMIDTIAVDYDGQGGTPYRGTSDAPGQFLRRSVSRGPTYVAIFKQPPEDGIPRIRYTGPPREFEDGRPVIFSSSPAGAKAGICGRNMVVVEVVDYAKTFEPSDCPAPGG